MSRIDFSYLQVVNNIAVKGYRYIDKDRDCERLQIPSYTIKHNFDNGFPALSIKQLKWNDVVGELIWFLRGDTNIKFLLDNNIKIWNKDAYNWYKRCLKKKGVEPCSYKEFLENVGKHNDIRGDVGKNYGSQWRAYRGEFENVDQIHKLVEDMKENIMSTKLKVNAWNPAELSDTALAPCHDGFQIVGVPLGDEKYGFELHWNQRSVDTFLGLPFNIASYALLAKILEKLTGHKALGIEGSLHCVHLYENQYDGVKTLMERDTTVHGGCDLDILSKFEIDDNIDDVFESLNISDFNLINYTCNPQIKVPMLAPKN